MTRSPVADGHARPLPAHALGPQRRPLPARRALVPLTRRPRRVPGTGRRRRGAHHARRRTAARPASRPCRTRSRPAAATRSPPPRGTLLGQAQIHRARAGAEVVADAVPRARLAGAARPVLRRSVRPRRGLRRSERLQLLDALRDPANGIKNVVVVSGAAGGTLSSELRLQTLEAGGAIGTGIREFATGRSRNGLLGALPDAAAWRLILHGALPNGVGARLHRAFDDVVPARDGDADVAVGDAARSEASARARRRHGPAVRHRDAAVHSLTGSGPGSTSARLRSRRSATTPASRPASTPVMRSRFSATTTSAVAASMYASSSA